MKKVLLLIAVVAVLSGCGTNDKLTCTYDNTVGDVTSKTEYVIEYRNNNCTFLFSIVFLMNQKRSRTIKSNFILVIIKISQIFR